MIFNCLNNKNVKFKIVDSNKNEQNEEIYLEVIFNKHILKEFILTLLLLKQYAPINKVQLTSKEQEVLKYLADGGSNETIAKKMDLSVHTVKAHIHNIIHKLNAQDRTHAVVKAIKQEII